RHPRLLSHFRCIGPAARTTGDVQSSGTGRQAVGPDRLPLGPANRPFSTCLRGFRPSARVPRTQSSHTSLYRHRTRGVGMARPNNDLKGTLALLVLRTLASAGPMHGYAITAHIQSVSRDMLRVEEGSLYPALHRMEQDGWLRSSWGMTEKNREA